jgi:predicted kinase
VPINKPVDIPAPNYNIQNIPAETHKGFNVDNVNNTQLPATVATLPISKTLSGTSEALDDLINALVDSGEISTANVFLLNTLQGLVRPSNFKLVYSNDASMKGNYNYETSTVTINPNHKSIKTIDDVATTLAHELVHSATGLTIKQYEAGLTNELTSEQVKAVENLKSVQNKYIEYLASQGKAAQLAAFTEDYKAWKKGNKSINFTKDQIAEFYGAMKLSEFVTMALTDVAFQERLKNIKDAEDKSLWNQILEAITELINTLGITIPEGSILAGALKSSMDLINANQEALTEEEDVFFPDIVAPIQLNIGIDKKTPDVILPIGTSGSGKSTFIKSLPQKNLVIIEPDAMRVEFTGDINNKSKDKEIYEEAAKRAIQAVRDGKQVVFDTTNLTKDKRRPFIEAIRKEIPNANIQYKLMELNPELAKQRIKAQIARGENRANVSDETIDRHAKSYEEMLEDIKQEAMTPYEDIIKDNKFTYEGKTIDTDFTLTQGQDKALKRLVDFTKSSDKFITLQGAAGTGKTAVIGYLQKYFANTGTTFVYMAPTHAATAELAFATVKSGNKQLPMTVQSAISAQRDRETGELKIGFTKKLADKLGFSDNIIVLDEVSMLSAKDYNNLKIAIQKHNAKVIFMGDILQIPEVDVANPTQKQVSKAFTDNEQVALTEVKRTESDAILEVLGQLRNDTRPAIPMIPNTEEIKFLKGSEYNQELLDTIKEDPENGVVISYTNNGVSAVNKKIRKLLGREGDLQQGDVIVGYLGYSSKQIENADIANSIRYTVDKVNRIGSKYEMIVKSEKLDSLQKAGVKVSGTATGNYVQLSNTDTFEFEDLTQEDFDTNNQEISSLMQRLVDAKKAALANPRRWVDYYSIQGEVARYFSKNILGGDYIYNPATGQMEKFISLQHGQLKKANPELFVEKGIDLGHAITIHKSQGSTVKNVFFDASTLPKGSSSKLFQGQTQIGNEKHSLIYVAMSRASGKLVVNTEMGQNFYSLRGPKLDLSGLQNTEDFMQMPPDVDERSGGPSPDDWDAYNAAMSSDDSLFDSPINRELYEKYLLLCGK